MGLNDGILEAIKSTVQNEISKQIDNEIQEKVNQYCRELTDRKDKYISEIMKGIRIASETEPYSNTTNYRILFENVVRVENKHNEDSLLQNIKEYADWHINHLTEDIEDYIDDDKIGNKNIIGELKESREHWFDIKRILEGKPTYIDIN